MALITDYSTLKTAVSDYLARSDLSGFVPNFIQNCESKLYKRLRIRAMENALSVAISSGVAALPTSPAYVELKYAYVSSGGVTYSLDRVPPDQIYAAHPQRSGTASIPKMIAVEGSNFIFGPYPGDYTVNGIYYGRLTALSDSNTTNWFTANAPELLLYGALMEATPFLMDDARIATWRAFHDEAFIGVRDEERRQKSSGGSIAARLG